MGEVYVAGHRLTPDESFAVKVIRPDLETDAKARKLFLKEGSIAARLKHENIVSTYLPFEHDECLFLPMELLRGRSLSSAIRDRGLEPWPLSIALPLVLQAAGALGYAHNKRVIHRDIKPENLFLTDDDQVVKVLDFGIAKAMATGHTSSQAGLKGTPVYLPPELLRGQRPTPAVDVYALGMVLFRLLAGRLPIEAPTDGGVAALMMHTLEVHEEGLPRLSQFVGVPESIDELTARLVAGDLEIRPADGNAAADLLAAALAELGPEHAVPKRRADPGVASEEDGTEDTFMPGASPGDSGPDPNEAIPVPAPAQEQRQPPPGQVDKPATTATPSVAPMTDRGADLFSSLGASLLMRSGTGVGILRYWPAVVLTVLVVVAGLAGVRSWQTRPVYSSLEHSDEAARQMPERTPIEELEAQIAAATGPERAGLRFQLAELHARRAAAERARETAAFEDRHAWWLAAGRQGEQPTLAEYLEPSTRSFAQAAAVFQTIVVHHPRYGRMDEVLYQLGQSAYQAGKKDDAIGHYRTLIEQHPERPRVADAWVALAQHFLTAENPDDARSAFTTALKSADVNTRGEAQHGLASCDYEAKEYASGLARLKQVVEQTPDGDSDTAKLKARALADLPRFLAHGDDIDAALEYFKEHSSSDTMVIAHMTELADQAGRLNRSDAAKRAYQLIVDAYPRHIRGTLARARLAAIHTKAGQARKARDAVNELIEAWGPDAAGEEAVLQAGAQARLESDIRLDHPGAVHDLAVDYHLEGQRDQDQRGYRIAKELYFVHLALVGLDSPYAYEPRFFYAETLWALRAWQQAAQSYGHVARTELPGGVRGEYAQRAAYNAALAWEKSVGRRTDRLRVPKLAKGKRYDEQPIPEAEIELVRACDLYATVASTDDADLPAVRFKAAYVYFIYNHFTEAGKRYGQIVEQWPGTALARKSAFLSADILNVQKQWIELEEQARRFRDNSTLIGDDSQLAGEFAKLIEGASFKSILAADSAARDHQVQAERAAALAKVARRFAGFQAEFPGSPHADAALFNALLIYDQAGELDNAIDAAELLSKRYQKSPHQERARWLLAGMHERAADYAAAAHAYAEFYKRFRRGSHASDALFNSALYFGGLGEVDRAITQYRAYTEAFAKKGDASEVYTRICKLLDRAKRFEASAKCWRTFWTKYRRAPAADVFEAKYRWALALEASGDHRRASKSFRWLVDMYPELTAKDRELSGVQRAAAHAAFELLETDFEAFNRMKLTTTRASLEAKAAKANELTCLVGGSMPCEAPGKYFDVVGYGNADYGIAALVRMGQIQRGMAEGIRNAPLPARLSAAQTEVYRAELAKVALRPHEQAVDLLRKALNKAYEVGVYGQWTDLALRNLRALQPDELPAAPALSPRDTHHVALLGVSDIEAETAKHEETLQVRPHDADAANMLAALLRRKTRYGEAIVTLRRLLMRDQDNPRASESLGLVHLDEGRTRLARLVLSNGLRVTEKGSAESVDLLVSLGVVELAEGGPRDAALSFRKALATRGDHPLASFNLGSIMLTYGNYEGAATAFETAAQAWPNDFEVRTALGHAYLGQGRAAKAVTHLEAARQLRPDEAPFERLAVAYAAAKNRAKALESLDAWARTKHLSCGDDDSGGPCGRFQAIKATLGAD